MDNFPRRNQLDKCCQAELSIDDAIRAVWAVYQAGADVKLIDAIVKS